MKEQNSLALLRAERSKLNTYIDRTELTIMDKIRHGEYVEDLIEYRESLKSRAKEVHELINSYYE